MTKAEVKHRDIFNGNNLRDHRIVTSIMKGNYFVGEKAGKFTVFRAVIKDNRFQVITIGTECYYRRITEAYTHVHRLQGKIYHARYNNLLN